MCSASGACRASCHGRGAETSQLSADDLDRLRYATGRRSIDLGASLFGGRSITWRVNREGILLLGGGRALLLQVAHPLVAAGVAGHSQFRRQPLQRLWRTLDLMLTITFSNAAAALRAVRTIERVHAQVNGRLEDAVGPFPGGTPYDANDPALMFWVHATLLDSALLVYERFVAPLEARERRRYYEESKITARLFGIPEALIPATDREFRDYFDAMIAGPELAVGVASKEIAAAVLWPPLLPGLRHAVAAGNALTAGLLPAPLRERYGFTWGARREAGLDALAAVTRNLLPVLPGALRQMPHARRGTRG